MGNIWQNKIMTEDDTFNRLCKATFEQVAEHYEKIMFVPAPEGEFEEIMARFGWDGEEFKREWNTRCAEGQCGWPFLFVDISGSISK